MEQQTLVIWEPVPRRRPKRLAGDKALVELQRLADWYTANKPTVRKIHVSGEQWAALDALANRPGKVRRVGARLFFGEFELLRVEERESGGEASA